MASKLDFALKSKLHEQAAAQCSLQMEEIPQIFQIYTACVKS